MFMKQKKSNRPTAHEELTEGIVTEAANRQVKALADGQSLSLAVPSALLLQKNAVAVGDRVKIALTSGKQQKLVEVLPRETAFYRGNRRAVGEEILVAANVQQVLAVVTADYLMNQCGFVESALIAARRAGLPLMVYVSKLDAVSEAVQEAVSRKLERYRDTGTAVFFGTLAQPDEALLPALRGKITLLVGDRGSGKSTLMLSLLQKLEGSTRPFRASPTSASVWVEGQEDTVFLDTPGFRDFALVDVQPEERDAAFPEIAKAAGDCGFADCTHTHEPSCAVTPLVQSGDISRERYSAYQKLSGRAVSAPKKADYRVEPCTESFPCKNCGELVIPEGAGTQHRNHCPKCLCSVHVDNEPGDRASTCHGVMEPISVWVRKDGEWALIHRCRVCGALSSNRIAADDNPLLLMSIAVRPLAKPAFPLNELEVGLDGK